MKPKSTNEPYLTTAQKLTKALSAIDDPVLRGQLELVYVASNPIEWAKELLSLELDVSLTRELLIVKCSAPSKSGRPELGPLLERAMNQWWASLAERSR